MGGTEHIGLDPDVFQFLVPGAQNRSQLLRLAVQSIQFIVGLLQHEGRRSVVLLRLLGCGRKLIQGVQPDSYLHALELFLQFQILFCFFGLLPQRLQLELQLGDLVANAQKIVLGVLELALRLLLAVAKLGDARRLFKNFPAVSAFQCQNLVDPALADIGIALLAQARIHEQLIDVPQTGGLLVDIVFAVTGAVIPPGDAHGVRIVGQSPVRIVQGQRSLRKAHRCTLLGAAENDILHFGAPESFGTLLAHDPQNGIGYI